MTEDAPDAGFRPYLNVVPLLNGAFAGLWTDLAEYDTRARHLKDFEVLMGAALKKQPCEYGSYGRAKGQNGVRTPLPPLPDDDDQYVPSDIFRAWIVVYEEIMREAGSVCGGPPVPLEEAE